MTLVRRVILKLKPLITENHNLPTAYYRSAARPRRENGMHPQVVNFHLRAQEVFSSNPSRQRAGKNCRVALWIDSDHYRDIRLYYCFCQCYSSAVLNYGNHASECDFSGMPAVDPGSLGQFFIFKISRPTFNENFISIQLLQHSTTQRLKDH